MKKPAFLMFPRIEITLALVGFTGTWRALALAVIGSALRYAAALKTDYPLPTPPLSLRRVRRLCGGYVHHGAHGHHSGHAGAVDLPLHFPGANAKWNEENVTRFRSGCLAKCISKGINTPSLQ